MDVKIAKFLVHHISSRALYTSDHSDTKGDMLDTFYCDLQTKWDETRAAKWKTCLFNEIPENSYTEMIESSLSALLPDKVEREIIRMDRGSGDGSGQLAAALHKQVETLVINTTKCFFNFSAKVDQYQAMNVVKHRVQNMQIATSARHVVFSPDEEERVRASMREQYVRWTGTPPITADFPKEGTQESENKSPTMYRFCSAGRYGPDIHSELAPLETMEEVLKFLQNFVVDVCASVLYFTVCGRMDVLGGTIHALPMWACVACHDHEIQVLFLPCRHRCLCVNCYNNIRICPGSTCPMCRSTIRSAIRLRRPLPSELTTSEEK